MKKRQKVDKKTIIDDVQGVIDTWNSRFGDLKKRKEAGEKVSNDEVRAIVLDVGADIYQKGIQPDGADKSKKSVQFDEIFHTIEKQKFPLDSVDDSSRNKIKVNAIQLAAIESGDSGPKGQVIAAIVRDPDFVPPPRTDHVHDDEPDKLPTPALEQTDSNPAVLATSAPGDQESIEEQSARASRNLLAKLAPPEGLEQASPATVVTAPQAENNQARDIFGDDFMKQGNGAGRANRAPLGAAGSMSDTNTDALPAQVIQMPVQVIQPMDGQKDLPKDALGRIIR